MRTLSQLKKGDLFRFVGTRKVMVFQGGGKSRGYAYMAYGDINDTRVTKKNRYVETDFTY